VKPSASGRGERTKTLTGKAASALNHPNIITIHDIDQAYGVDYIPMEYVAGKTLDRLIPRHGMRLNEALKTVLPQSTVGDWSLTPSCKSTCSRFGANQNQRSLIGL
jgi:serine/threonine protein kinase